MNPEENKRYLARLRENPVAALAWLLWGIGRLGFLASSLAAPAHNPDAERYYIPIARNLAEHAFFSVDGTLPSAQVSPLYPLFVALCQGVWGFESFAPTLLVQLVLDAGVLILVMRLAAGETDQKRAVGFAGCLYALYLPAARAAANIQTETLFIFLLGLVLLLFQRALLEKKPRDWGLAGLTLGLAILCRPTIALWLPGLPLLLLFPKFRSVWNTRGILVTAVVATLILVPWTIRNAGAFGRFIPFAAQGSYTIYRGAIGDGTIYTPIPEELERRLADASEMERADLFSQAAGEQIRREPGHYLLLVVKKACRLWFHVPWPRPLNKKNYLSIAFHLGIWALVIWSLWARRQSPSVLSLLLLHLALYLTAVHAMTYAVIRYSMPIVAYLPAISVRVGPWAHDADT